MLESQEQFIGQGRPFQLPVDAGPIGERPAIETIQGPYAMQKAELEAFMAEYVEVLVHESPDPNAENPVFFYVNGKPQGFRRGIPQKCRRMYVEVMARCKHTSFSQVKEGTAEQQNTMYPHTAVKYPFAVTKDPNPKGAEWLRTILAQQV